MKRMPYPARRMGTALFNQDLLSASSTVHLRFAFFLFNVVDRDL